MIVTHTVSLAAAEVDRIIRARCADKGLQATEIVRLADGGMVLHLEWPEWTRPGLTSLVPGEWVDEFAGLDATQAGDPVHGAEPVKVTP